MLTARRRYNSEQKKHYSELMERFGEIPKNELLAAKLRMDFVRNFVLGNVYF